jgi:hypothetical protein
MGVLLTNSPPLVPDCDHRFSGSPTRRCALAFMCMLGLLFLGATSGVRADSVSKEYQLKAAFLYNFTKFVDWPSQQFADDTSPIVIAVLGKNPFGSEMENLVRNRSVNGRSISIRYIESIEEMAGAHIVFISSGAESRLGDSLFGRPGVLTVGESSDFASRGGIIRFALIGEKVRFEINQASSEKAGLKLSGQLLKLAMIVRKTQ